jgi:FMN phosphatase YigB (HAD superfamily)
MPAIESMHTIFFDIDDTLVDYKAAERAAALVFYQDHIQALCR